MNRLVAVLTLAVLAGCDAAPPERLATGASGTGAEPMLAVPPGTAPRGTSAARAALSPPGPAISRGLLARGRDRYDAFCAPCHGLAGYGDGVVVQRGFPAPPSFHADRQLGLARARIVQVIGEGVGQMYGFAERVPPQDRWAIASYVKALQLSQSAPIDALPEDLRRQVEP